MRFNSIKQPKNCYEDPVVFDIYNAFFKGVLWVLEINTCHTDYFCAKISMIYVGIFFLKVRRLLMCKSGNKWLSMLVWLLTGVASLHYGMMQLGYDLRTSGPLASLHPVLNYLFAAAGLVSLVWWVMWVLGGCEECR